MTSNNGQWTAEDLPPALPFDDEGGHLHLTSVVRGALAAWLNENHPKPTHPMSREAAELRRERDAAVARAEAAERERDEAIRDRRQMEDDHAKMCREWRGMDARAVEAERERDAAVARAEQAGARVRLANQQSVEWEGEAERLLCERDEWKARAEAAEADNADAKIDGDPAVHVVRESDLPAARVDGDYYVVASAKGDYKWPQHGPSWWAGRAQDALAEAARYTSLARLAADREATVDPVEAKARAEADRRYSGDTNHAFIEGAVWAARHVLGQEDSHVDR